MDLTPEDQMSDSIELQAWRFLAARRCPGLAVAHLEFVDGAQPTVVTPADQAGFYASASGHTFGEAAVLLALKLGMRCTDSDADRIGSAQGRSSAAIATAGETATTTRRTRSRSAASTTDATNAGRRTAGRGEP